MLTVPENSLCMEPRKQMLRFVASLHELPVIRPPCVRRRTFFSALGLTSTSSSGQNQQYHESKILPYRREQLYKVVADVDAYHRFIPYCTASRVLKRTKVTSQNPDTTKDIENMEAELKVGFMGLEEKYISNVHCGPYDIVQAVASSQIPLFKSLVTTWRFQPASPASPHPSTALEPTLNRTLDETRGPTLVTFDLEYAFANPVYAHLSAAFFSQVSKMMIQAFEKRCLEVYGLGVE